MRKCLTILTFILLTAPLGWAEVTKSRTFTATGSDTSVTLINQNITNHRFVWTGKGTRTTCQVKLEQSVDNTTWTDLVPNQTCTGDGSVTTAGLANYIRITLSALSGSGNTLYVIYTGTSSFVAQSPYKCPDALSFKDTKTMNATTGQDIIAADPIYRLCVTGGSTYNQDATNSELMQVLYGGDIGTGTFLFGLAAPVNSGEVKTPLDPPFCTPAVNQKLTVDSTGSANPVTVTVWGCKVLP